MTTGQVLNAHAPLRALIDFDAKSPCKLGDARLKLVRNFRKTSPIAAHFAEENNALIQEFGVDDGKGGRTVEAARAGAAAYAAFMARLAPLLAEPHEIELVPFGPLDGFAGRNEIPAAILADLLACGLLSD